MTLLPGLSWPCGDGREGMRSGPGPVLLGFYHLWSRIEQDDFVVSTLFLTILSLKPGLQLFLGIMASQVAFEPVSGSECVGVRFMAACRTEPSVAC